MSGTDKNAPSSSNQSSEVAASSSQSSIRWIDLTEEQKKSVMRIRNAESAKRSRQNKREKEAQMKERWEENEKKIKSLEKLIEDLSNEIQPGTFRQQNDTKNSSPSKKGRKQ